MAEVKDFFFEENRIDHIPDEAYNDIDCVIETVEAISRTTYASIYIIDYHKRNFLYVSNNFFYICGLKASEVKDLGFNFYIERMKPTDMNFLVEMDMLGFQFFQKLPIERRKKYTMSYDFHITNNKSGKQKYLINHQLTPLRLTEDGKVWLALCVVSIPSNRKAGNITMLENNSDGYWFYNKTCKQWDEVKYPQLKDEEKDVLKLSAMGFTVEEIATRIGRSLDTAKKHRKNIFEKLNVKNISEAISRAKSQRLM
jgi:DNA-binding CsgD family transcriptional regulator